MFSLKFCFVLVTILAIFAEAAFALSLEHAQNRLEEISNEQAAADPSDDLDWLRYLGQENRFKRRKFDKSDPRSLFAAVYSNYPYSKRFSEPSYYYPEAAALQIPQHSLVGGIKRGFRSINDPRNLFRAVYGYKK